jgi:hypothetical protein
MSDPFAFSDVDTRTDPFAGDISEGSLDFLTMDDLSGRVVAFVPTGETGTSAGANGADYVWYGCDAYPITGSLTDKITALGEPIQFRISAKRIVPRIQAAVRAGNRPFVGIVGKGKPTNRSMQAPWDLAPLPESGPERDAWNAFLASRKKG